MREIGSIREFNNGTYELIEDNIIPEKKKMKFILWLNIITIIVLVIGLIPIFMYYNDGFEVSLLTTALLCLGFLPYVVLHELLHGAAFRIFNKTTKEQTKFGLVLKSGMAYCISTVPVKVDAARLSLMMPLYVICIPMMVLGVVFQRPEFVLFGWLYATGSSGDIYYMWKLRHTSKNYYMHEEMPTKSGYEVGYLLYKKQ